MSGRLTGDALREKVASLGWWYHNIDLGDGVFTSPNHPDGDYPRTRWDRLAPHLPDLRGKSVLDIGCAGGFFSIEMKRSGAERVLGIDYAANHVEQSRFAARQLGLDIEFRQMDCYDIADLDESFDVIVFLGVLYHLRHPLLALDIVRSKCTEAMLFQTVTWDRSRPIDIPGDFGAAEGRGLFGDPAYPTMYFVEDRFNGDPTNWWIVNRNGVMAMLRAAGFSSVVETEQSDEIVVYTGAGPAGAIPLAEIGSASRHQATGRARNLLGRFTKDGRPAAKKGTYGRPVGMSEER